MGSLTGARAMDAAAERGAGFEGDAAAGTVFAEDGVRKSSRAAKPKILDFLPSAVCVKVANEAPGASAIDRRVRVFWPAEGAFFSGLVVAFNAKNGKHKIRYDDGDVEEVLLAAERIEWVEPGEDETKFSRGRPPSPRGRRAELQGESRRGGQAEDDDVRRPRRRKTGGGARRARAPRGPPRRARLGQGRGSRVVARGG